MRAATFQHAGIEYAKILFEQNDVRCRLGDIGCAVDRYADIRGLQRRRVVNAVAQVADGTALRLERQDDAVFLGGREPAHQICFLRPDRESGFVHLLHFASGQHASDRYPELGEEVARYLFAIPGNDFDVDTASRQRAYRFRGALLGRIEKSGKPGKSQFALIIDHGMGMVGGDLAPGDAEQAQTALRQAVVQFTDRFPRLRVKCRDALVAIGHIVRAQLQNVFRSALDGEHAAAFSIQQNRDAAALEIERHLVYFAPAADVD